MASSTQELTRYVCLFHDGERARAAVNALEDAGFSGVQTVGDGAYATGMTGSQTLLDLQIPGRDVEHLQDGLRRGGVVVWLEAAEGRSREVEAIFHRYSAGKIDDATTETDAPAVENALPAAAATGAARALAGETAGRDAAATEAVIPVAEESLIVGKREVDRGGVRVLRHTVEQPVSENVDLHGERVVLEYRETNRPATEADLRAGTQQIELVETAEVPVVQKVARVVEEVRVGKVETDRTETVQDSVRHTEVQVEDVDGGTRRSDLDRR